MKELSIEEKAKAYDEAIKRIQSYVVDEYGCTRIKVVDVFPELKKSEDERIRKALIRYFTLSDEHAYNEACGVSYRDIVAWLEKQGNLIVELQKTYVEIGRLVKENYYLKEKQGEQKPVEWNGVDNAIVEGICLALEYSNESGETIEKYENWLHSIKDRVLPFNEVLKQKPADKVEPKFKIEKDKWYICIRDLDDNYGTRAFCKGSTYYSTKDETLLPDNSNIPFEIKYCVNDYFRPWTIQDAKESDMLVTKAGGIFIYKELLYDKPFAYCGVDKFGVFKDCNCGDGLDWTPYLSDVTPATKEQRDLLFQKMKEAGYEWDAEKKKLKKIEQKQDVNIQINPSEYINDMGGNGCYLKNTTQNHAWSEEDEDYYNAIITKLEVTQDDALLTDNQIEFLKSLKEKVQPKREWNEENKKMLECAIDMIEWYSVVNKSKSKLVSDWLKSLRPQS